MGNAAIPANIANTIATVLTQGRADLLAQALVSPHATDRLDWLTKNPNLTDDDKTAIKDAWNILAGIGDQKDQQHKLDVANDIINEKLNNGNDRDVVTNLGFDTVPRPMGEATGGPGSVTGTPPHADPESKQPQGSPPSSSPDQAGA